MKKNHTHKGVGALVSVKEIMSLYGISYQAVNHYTDFGLLPVPVKKGNVRYYDKDVVDERLREIRKLAGEGYSLRLIRRQLLGV